VAGRRGRPRIYGENRIQLAKQAGQRRGWTTEVFELYDKLAKKRYKTFVATWRPIGGMIRVVLVDEPDGWVAYFCTDLNTTVAKILATAADRFALETTFRDCKEIVGANQQQVRFVWANIGAFHVCLWTLTMTEAWAWTRGEEELVDRQASPWDDPSRRPSHANKHGGWRRELLADELPEVLPSASLRRKFEPSPSGYSPWRHESELNREKYSFILIPDKTTSSSKLLARRAEPTSPLVADDLLPLP
jgi:hypothetical protein